MFRIGEFSRVARVSARLLRYYEQIGLFTPGHTEPATGYRYYRMAQLPELNRIIVLKELGFTLEQVRELLAQDVDADELRNLLTLRRNDVLDRLAEESERLALIESRIAQLDEDGSLEEADVVIRPVPAQRLLSLRRTVPSFAEAQALIGELAAAARGVLPRRAGRQLIAIAHSPQFEPDAIDVEFGYLLDEETPVEPGPESPLAQRRLDAVQRMAVCVRIGPPQAAHAVTTRIGRFLEAAGDRLDGPGRELFLEPPDPERLDRAVVEMQFPLADRARDNPAPVMPAPGQPP